jgi:hypothetical protein
MIAMGQCQPHSQTPGPTLSQHTLNNEM